LLKRLVPLLLVAAAACDADHGPSGDLASARSGQELGVVTHRVSGLATETATSATDQPVEGRVLQLEGSRDVRVPMGQLLRIELQANAGTGYVWQCRMPSGAVVRQLGEPSSRPIDRGVMGGRLLWILTFEPIQPGTSTLAFELVRPWEKGVPPAKTAQVVVHVGSAAAGPG
jgi:predicted secreted protein